MTSATLQDALDLVSQLSPDDQRALLHTLQNRIDMPGDSADIGWQLEGEQLAFMLQHHDAIEAAYAGNDMAFLDALESSDEYRARFGDMPWDEAYDKFEETREELSGH